MNDPALFGALDRIMTMCPEGWATGSQICWTALGNSKELRSLGYRVLEALGDEGILERILVRHNNVPMDVYNIDIKALHELVDGWPA
jgi:hypothetical protein